MTELALKDMSLALRHAGPADAVQLKDQILPVYAMSHADQMHDPWFAPAKFWERLVRIYAQTPEFDLVTGWIGSTVVGYAFGSPRTTDDLWPQILAHMPHIAPEGHVYIFREFAVAPDHQRQGIGKRIHDELLRPRTEKVAHLLVRPDNPARAAYTKWGWTNVGTKKPFDDSPTFDALALDLAAWRTTASRSTP
jgi:ribosomal protein S18 acetylase RimI-like enzyme